MPMWLGSDGYQRRIENVKGDVRRVDNGFESGISILARFVL
jgi:hypothetical protein